MTDEVIKTPQKAPLWLISISILVPTAFAMLATSATNVAIPHIAGYFGSTIDEANWVITSYMIANACLILMTGWLENFMGRKNFLKVFISIFTVGSLICAVAPNLNFMVLGRLIQGIGGGPMMPISQAILLESFPFEKRGLAMSLFGLAVMVFSILGPSFGGFIVDNSAWQWIYYINIPIGIISVILVHCNIPELEIRKKIEKIDFPGMISLVVWLLTMQVVLDKGQQYNWFDCAWISWLAGISACAMAFFIVWELECKHALINIGTLLGSSVNVIIYVTILLLPQFLQNMMGYTAMLSGFSLAPRVISCVIMLLIIGPLMNVVDNRFLISSGFFFLGLSTIMFMNLNLSVSFTYVAIPNIIMGIGVILVFIPVSSLVLGTLPKSELSNGASLHSLCKCVATAFVISMSSTLVARHSQMHQVYLVRHLSNFNLTFQHKFAAMVNTFMSSASSVFAQHKANGFFYKQLVQQSRLMAFVDVFELFALLAFILIPYAFALKVNIKSRRES